MIIYANLDCEARWAGQQLPQHVLRRISAASALLAAFADGDAEIYAPAEVDASRLAIDVRMRTGEPARYDLAWAQPDAKAANDRRLALAVAREIGCALPGARVIELLSDLDAELAPTLRERPNAITPGPERWVCKAPWTSAGRDRVIGYGEPTSEQRVYLARLLEKFGALVFEPWLERIVDLGVCVEHGKAHRPHTLLCDDRGGFAGIDLAEPALSKDEHHQLEEAVAAAKVALALVDYAGPFTIDAFVYRDGAERKLHPICEINARYSFGHVARALGAKRGCRRLGFGAPPPDVRDATVLVKPAADDPFTAWVA